MSKGGHRHGCYRHAPSDLQEPRRWRSLFGLSERSNIREFALAERTSLVSVKYCSALGTGRFAGVSPRSTAEKLRSAGSPDVTNRRAHSPGEKPAHVRPRPPSAAIPDVGSAAMCSSTRRTPEKFSAATPNLSPSCRGYSRGDTAHQALAFAQGPCTNQLPGGGSVRPLAQRRGKG